MSEGAAPRSEGGTRVTSAGARRVLELLRDGRWYTSAEIEQACQVTAHSRIAELRKGHVIDKRHNRGATGRRMFSYRLVGAREDLEGLVEAEPQQPIGVGSGSASTSSPGLDASDGQDDRVLLGGGADAAVLPDPELEDADWRELFHPGQAA